ncbi:MAG: hypothetical protein WD942_09785 [Dehalococcoidia bacterium]
MLDDLDALGLLTVQSRSSVRFGSVDATPGLLRANLTNSLSQMPDAQIVLDLERTPTPIDYFSTLVVSETAHGQELPRFTGSIVSATPTGGEVVIKAVGAVSLAESLIPGMVVRGVPAFELVYVLARGGGFRDDQLRIEGLETLPRETFEVLAPVDGISLREAVAFGGVRFVPPSLAWRAITGLQVDEELRKAYEASAYAFTLVTANRCLEAENVGLASIDDALAWLTARLRHGSAVLPDGRPLAFQRSEALAMPRRRDLTVVRGLSTERHWMRRPQAVQASRAVDVVPDQLRLDPHQPALTLQERLGLRALYRATQERDALAQVQALFEAIEFYTAGVTIDALFTKSERRQLLRTLPKTLSAKQRERVEHVLGVVNNAPLGVRLMSALDQDEVPLAPGEIDLLWRLRKVRNDVVHGRTNQLPSAEDVEYAMSIVARMFLYRAAIRDSIAW